MNYGDHNFIELHNKLSCESLLSCRAVELVVSSESSCAVRQCRHSQNAYRAKWNLGLTRLCVGKKRRPEGHLRSIDGVFANAVEFLQHYFSDSVNFFNGVNFFNRD